MIYLLTFKPVDVTKFASFDDRPYFGEPLLVPFYNLHLFERWYLWN